MFEPTTAAFGTRRSLPNSVNSDGLITVVRFGFPLGAV
jgi:hypothetical protein